MDWGEWDTPTDGLPGGGVVLFELHMLLFLTDSCNNSESERKRERERERETLGVI